MTAVLAAAAMVVSLQVGSYPMDSLPATACRGALSQVLLPRDVSHVDLEEACQPPDLVQLAQFEPSRTDWGSGVEQWRPLVAGHFRPGDVATAMCLIGFESGGDPGATSRAGARGLLQVMPFWADYYDVAVSDLYSPEVNLHLASRIRDTNRGWLHWSPYKRGECRGL